nr:integrase, catalytic region, zinc finger, CCHC-type, peptidase aspartic, catalytic [Tanacetum cinerariifolium]
ILKSIDEGPYKLGTFRETLAESTEGTPQFGPERPRVYSDLNSAERDRYNADIRATNILLQGLLKDIYTLINYYTDAKDIWDNVSNTQHGLPSSSTSSITPLTPPRANSTDDLIENLISTLALLTQSYRTFLPQTNNQLRTSSNPRNQATVQDGRVVVQNVHGRPNRGQGMNPWGGNAAGYGEAHNRVENVNQGQARLGQARTVKCYNCNGTGYIARNCTQPKRP